MKTREVNTRTSLVILKRNGGCDQVWTDINVDYSLYKTNNPTCAFKKS